MDDKIHTAMQCTTLKIVTSQSQVCNETDGVKLCHFTRYLLVAQITVLHITPIGQHVNIYSEIITSMNLNGMRSIPQGSLTINDVIDNKYKSLLTLNNQQNPKWWEQVQM